jgi:twitching motility protein PilT
MTTLSELLRTAVDMQGSDLHLTTGVPPVVRVDGDLLRVDGHGVLTDVEVQETVYGHLSAEQRRTFEEESELDLAFDVEGIARVRCNVFRQKGDVAAVYRLIPDRIRSVDELGLPPIVAHFATLPRGLVLVTGPTGSGKSTTLAALIDRINAGRRSHILTVEDPIEFLHTHKQGIVNQREVRVDTDGFGQALRSALREDPDVVLIGEMRDLETIEAALSIAETGHLTFATLHTNSASQTIDRIIDVFPAHQQAQVRTQVAMVLQGVVCQVLVPMANGRGRVAAVEVLVPTTAVRHLIREDKLHQLYSTMQSGQDKVGMQTMNQALVTLYRQGAISRGDAVTASSNREELQGMLARRPVARHAGGSRRVGRQAG